MPGRHCGDQFAMNDRRRASRHDQAAIQPACECRDGALDFSSIAYVDRAQIHSQRRRHGDAARRPTWSRTLEKTYRR
jgi:hypothetical protein